MSSTKCVIDFEERRRISKSNRQQHEMKGNLPPFFNDRFNESNSLQFLDKKFQSILLSAADQKEFHHLEMKIAVLEACQHKLIFSAKQRQREFINAITDSDMDWDNNPAA
jgi:hypothetical protein